MVHIRSDRLDGLAGARHVTVFAPLAPLRPKVEEMIDECSSTH
jgi:hypothetical protein